MPEPTTTLEWLTHYAEAGLSPVPIQPGRKAPTLHAWPDLRAAQYTPDDWESLFTDKGIGLILGGASGGLVDVDLDEDTAQRIAPYLMPHTLRGGRSERPYTHYFYRCGDLPEGVVNRQFLDPVKGGVLMELRVNGQTLVAPSIHPSGDEYQWWALGDPITHTKWGSLAPSVLLCASMALLARYWPDGAHHYSTFYLAGALLKDAPAYWSQGHRLWSVIEAVCIAAGDTHELESDRRKAVEDTLATFMREGTDPLGGWTKLVPFFESVGAGAAVQTARLWMQEVFTETPSTEPEAPLDGETEPTLDDEAEGGGRVFQITSLLDIIENGVPPTDWLVPDYLIRGKLHILASDAGSGKSFVALWMVREVLRANPEARVMYWDEENDAADIATRAVSLGFTREEFLRLAYYGHPAVNITLDDHLREAVLLSRDVDFIVIDSLWDLLSQVPFDPNNYGEVGIVMKRMEQMKRGGAAVLLIDHTAKKNARDIAGAPIKKASSHISYTLHVNTPFDRTGGGMITLHRVKARGGEVPEDRAIAVAVDPDTGSVDFRPLS